MTAAPEDRIREHLERKGGSTRVGVARLLGTWGLADDPSDTNRLLVARALEEVGVIARPPVEMTPVDEDVELLIADARALTANRRLREAAARTPAPRPTPSSANLPAPSRGDIRAQRVEDSDPAPVEIPPGLPRTLLGVGAAGIIGSLFLPWFRAERGGEEIPGLSTGWEWLTVIDGLLLAIALAAVALVLLRIAGELPAFVVAGLGILGAACVTYRIVAPPAGENELFVFDVSREIGPFVALLFLGIVVAGAGLLSPSRKGRFLPSGQAPEDPPA